jgi:hypothetical protein
MHGVEHDEAISIYALSMLARRLLRRHCPSILPPTMTPRNGHNAQKVLVLGSEHFAIYAIMAKVSKEV